jgi:hypothetical protein
MTRWKGRLLWASAILTVCVVYLWFFGTQTFFALWARNVGRRVPIVKSVPVDLKDLSISHAKGERLSFMGAEFEVPWDDMEREKTRIARNWVSVYFRSGNSILLCVEPADGFIANITKSKTPEPELFKAMYGPEVLQSDYALDKAILIKAIIPPTTDWAIYKVQSRNFRGFQLGDPVRSPKKMCLELFADDAHFEINIEQNTASAAAHITQPELNRMIQTLRKVPHTDANLTASSF